MRTSYSSPTHFYRLFSVLAACSFAFNSATAQNPTSGFRANLTNATTFASGNSSSFTNLQFTNVAQNSAGLSVQPDGSLVVTQAGLYSFSGHVAAFTGNANYADAQFVVNGAVVDRSLMAGTTSWNSADLTLLRELQIGDMIAVQMRPDQILNMDNQYSSLNLVAFTPVPEPSSILLSAIALVVAWSRRLTLCRRLREAGRPRNVR